MADELDYEMSNNYFLTVKAMDGGLRPLSDTTMVNILIADVNDNKPMFSQDIYYSEINEAARVEDSIAQVGLPILKFSSLNYSFFLSFLLNMELGVFFNSLNSNSDILTLCCM